MILTLTELVYLRQLINQYNIYIFYGLGLLARGHAPWVMGPTSPITVLANHSFASSVKC